MKVGDVNSENGRDLLRDTKNWRGRKLLLPRQSHEIATDHCSGKKPDDVLFPIVDARKTLAWIDAQAKTNVPGHGLRATCASLAQELVSGAVLMKTRNHAASPT